MQNSGSKVPPSYQDALTNIITSEHKDPIAGTQEYKAFAVKIEK